MGSQQDGQRKPGLRERKRRATENAIETAAVRISLEEGLDAATVERICDAVEISRTTFFNYFPTRDSAIFGRPIELEPSPRFDAVMAAWERDPVIGVVLGVLDAQRVSWVNSEVARMRAALFEAYPHSADHVSWAIGSARRQAEAVVADWFARHPERMRLDSPEREAHVVVALAALVADELFAVWLAGEGDLEVGVETVLEARERVRQASAPYS